MIINDLEELKEAKFQLISLISKLDFLSKHTESNYIHDLYSEINKTLLSDHLDKLNKKLEKYNL